MTWFKKKPTTKMSWPTPETDYEGNDLWALRLPKVKPLTPFQMWHYQGLAPMSVQAINAANQQMALINMGMNCNYGGLSGLFR